MNLRRFLIIPTSLLVIFLVVIVNMNKVIAKHEHEMHVDWCWQNYRHLCIEAIQLGKAGERGSAMQRLYNCQRSHGGSEKGRNCIEANWEASLGYLIRTYGQGIPPKHEHEMHVDWCWHNRREETMVTIKIAKSGDREPALRRLYECQSHNSSAVSCLKANWEAVFGYLVRQYGPKVGRGKQEYKFHVDWCWMNRRWATEQAIKLNRAHRRREAMEFLYKANPEGKNSIEANWEGVLSYLEEMYGPTVGPNQRWKASCKMLIKYRGGGYSYGSYRSNGYGISKGDAKRNAERECSESDPGVQSPIEKCTAIDCDYNLEK